MLAQGLTFSQRGISSPTLGTKLPAFSVLTCQIVVVVGVALATVPIKGTANVFCAVVDE